MNQEPLILIDVDETLIDINYQLNAPGEELRDAVTAAQARGALVGLNSDSAAASLARLARTWGMAGPIVAERGAVVQSSPDQPSQMTTALGDQFLVLRDRFVRALTSEQQSERILVVLGDVNGLSRTFPPILPYPHGNDAEILVLVNGFRTQSMSYYVRRRAAKCEDRWVQDPIASAAVLAILDAVGSSIGPKFWDSRDVDANGDYGICIVHDRQTQKANAVSPLLVLVGDRPISMIGNSMSDDCAHARVVQHAVANARPAYREYCRANGGIIASQPLTSGVIELLDVLTHT